MKKLEKIIFIIFVSILIYIKIITPMEPKKVTFVNQKHAHKSNQSLSEVITEYKTFLQEITNLSCIQKNPEIFVFQVIVKETLDLNYCKISSQKFDKILTIISAFIPYLKIVELCYCDLEFLPDIFYLLQKKQKFHNLIMLRLTGNKFSKDEKIKIKKQFSGVQILFK